MAKQIKEATETVVKVVRISGKTKPLAINGKENTDNVVFLRAFDAESGAKLDTPLSITESRAKMFGFSCLCISEETAERDNAGNMVEELNTLTNPPKYYEMTLRVIPKGEPGEWGYKTKKGRNGGRQRVQSGRTRSLSYYRNNDCRSNRKRVQRY